MISKRKQGGRFVNIIFAGICRMFVKAIYKKQHERKKTGVVLRRLVFNVKMSNFRFHLHFVEFYSIRKNEKSKMELTPLGSY